MYVPPQALDCTCASCSEGNCSIDLAGTINYVHVLNLDCLKSVTHRKGRISDCAILWRERGIFAIVELKGGRQDAVIDRLVKQIQSGLDIIDSLAPDQHLEDFYPILMYRGEDPTTAFFAGQAGGDSRDQAQGNPPEMWRTAERNFGA